MRTTVRYSEAFRLQVIRELEEGKFESFSSICRAYNIRGAHTVQRWVRRYGKEHLLRKVVRVQKPEEVDELKELRGRVRALEKALADAHLDLKLSDAYLHIACKTGGIADVEGFKKKNAGKL